MKFSEEELVGKGYYPGASADIYYDPDAKTERLNTPVTPRENYVRFLEDKDPLWVPDQTYDINSLFPNISPDIIAQSYSGGYDAFGVKWIQDASCPELPAFVEPGFIKLQDIEDWRELEFPKVESWDWEAAAESYRVLDPDRMNQFFLQSGMFERMIALLGFENAAVSFLLDPENVHDFLDAVVEFDIALMEHVHKYLKADILLFSDDWGSQRSPFFSEAIVEEFLAPRMSKLSARAHELGMYFGHHSCGNIINFVPYMIDENVDFWQFDYRAVENGIGDAIEQYGDRIKFDGNLFFLDEKSADETYFKNGAENFYNRYTKTKKCSFTAYDFYMDKDFDSRRYLYKLSREAYQ